MVANILPTDTPSTQGVGSKGQTISFSESSHVAYQIKADNAGSNMVANILPTDTPSTQGVRSKGQTISFSESSHVAYQIKGNWSQSTMKANMLSLHTPTTPWGGVKRSFSFLKVVMLHIKWKWKKCRPTCKVTLWIYTHPWPLGLGLKVRYWNCADVSIFFIKLSTKAYLTGVCYDLNDTEGELRLR